MIETIKIEKSIWVIGDVHGEYNQLIALLNKLPENAEICFVGDLIDRGDKSKEVVKLIRDKNFYVVKGNHEQMMIEGLVERMYTDFYGWIRNGGDTTIHSYQEIPREVYEEGFYQNEKFIKSLIDNKEIMNDVKWFKSLPIIIKFEIDGELPLYVSHSGLKLFEDDAQIEKENSPGIAMWNRIKYNEVDFAINIHGHTPKYQSDSVMTKSQINIDSGVYYLNRVGYGYLTAIEYPSMKRLHSKENIE